MHSLIIHGSFPVFLVVSLRMIIYGKGDYMVWRVRALVPNVLAGPYRYEVV